MDKKHSVDISNGSKNKYSKPKATQIVKKADDVGIGFIVMLGITLIVISLIIGFVISKFSRIEDIKTNKNIDIKPLSPTNCTIYFQNVSDNLVGYYYDSECLSEVN